MDGLSSPGLVLFLSRWTNRHASYLFFQYLHSVLSHTGTFLPTSISLLPLSLPLLTFHSPLLPLSLPFYCSQLPVMGEEGGERYRCSGEAYSRDRL